MLGKNKIKLFRNISVFGLIMSSILFGIIANIISRYDGSYFGEMFSGSISSFLITASPIILLCVFGSYLLYSFNK